MLNVLKFIFGFAAIYIEVVLIIFAILLLRWKK